MGARRVEECGVRRRNEGRRAAAQDVEGGARVQGTVQAWLAWAWSAGAVAAARCVRARSSGSTAAYRRRCGSGSARSGGGGSDLGRGGRWE